MNISHSNSLPIHPPKNKLFQPVHVKYRPDIDGLRALAVLFVIGFHAFPGGLRGGFIGVDIFFIISGYLITSIIFQNLQKNQFSFIDFYSRRIRRIYPALIFVLVVCYGFGWFVLFADEFQQLGKHIAAGAGFVSNIVLLNESGYFDSVAELKPLLHLWSLGVEEQFYIVWPVIIWVAWQLRKNILYLIALIAVSSFLLNVSQVSLSPSTAFYSPLTRFWELLMGSLLAYLVVFKQNVYSNPSQKQANISSILGGLAIIAGFLLITKEREFPGWWALLPTTGAVLLIGAGANGFLNKWVLANRILVWIGLISFPLYLWHWPLLSFAHILSDGRPTVLVRLVAVFAAVFAASITYYGVEKPLRFGPNVKLKTLVLFLVMVVIGLLGYTTYLKEGFSYRPIQSVYNQAFGVTPKYNQATTCDAGLFPANILHSCRQFDVANAKKTIVLWGDSSADAWAPVFLDIGLAQKYNVIVISLHSCPPILNARKTKFDAEESRAYCSDGKAQAEVIDAIKAIKPDLTFVIAAWNAYSPYTNLETLTDRADEAANAESTARVIKTWVPETLKLLESVTKVVVFKPWPIMPRAGMRGVSFVDLIERTPVIKTLPAKEFYAENKDINQILEDVELKNTVFYNPAARTCLPDCVNYLNGIKLYADSYHVRPQAAMLFREDILSLINENIDR